MSEDMTRAVIAMPFELAMGSEISRRQFYARAQTLLADLDEARNGMKHSCAIRLKKRIEKLETERDQLKAFAVEMINASFEGGSFDGGDIQDIAVKHGLLRIEQREDECGESCACRDYGFPAECYRKTPILGGGTDEVATPTTENENVSRHDRG
ncbi:hypothetical protein [Pseudomonas sp. NBRC 111137]|uniref:hypothetical protein n=1 Tax=Pseudomonas TaxID=286 RepID=UPI0012E2EA84|nr:hypothetical protein [Pseudomonas sp. NBRC 111137]